MNVIRRKPVTLADRHARASLRANVAIVTFTETADALDAAAEELGTVAHEAFVQGHVLHERSDEAAAEARSNRARARKIRELIGVAE